MDFKQLQFQKVGVALLEFYLFVLLSLRLLMESFIKAP